MIKVYGGWPTRSFRVLWALEELGVGYELHAVDLMRRNQDAELMQLNPAGFLPVLEYYETGFVGRFPLAVLAAILVNISIFTFLTGLVSETNLRYHREAFQLRLRSFNRKP